MNTLPFGYFSKKSLKSPKTAVKTPKQRLIPVFVLNAL
jgi:hypothetical protein